MHKPDPAKDAEEARYRARQVPNRPERLKLLSSFKGTLLSPGRGQRRPRPVGRPLAVVSKLEDAATLFVMGGDDEDSLVEVVSWL